VWRGGWPILLIGLFSILFSLLYTAGPYPLAYLGLGDVFVFIFFGLVAVSGTYYVQALSINPVVFFMGSLPGLLSVAILTVNNLRDMDEDRLHNKRTLAVRFGRTFAQVEYGITLIIAALIPLYFAYVHPESQFLLALCSLQGVLISRFLIKTVFTYKHPEQLNPMLGRTGFLLFLYSLTFSFAIIGR
jgi:1,4-dihydroxy-2-naphthoate octaprenyltransferase